MRRTTAAFVLVTVAVLALLATPAHGFLKAWSGKRRGSQHAGASAAKAEPFPIPEDSAEMDEDVVAIGRGLKAPLSPNVVAHNRALMQEYETRAAFSDCWREAVGRLDETCGAALSEDTTRARLAIAFTTCQLRADGKETKAAECPDNYDVRACTAQLSEHVYTLYTTYRIHVDTLCFHVQQELFQRRSDAAVARLHQATKAAGSHITDLDRRTSEWGAAVEAVKKQQAEALEASASLAAALSRLGSLEQGLHKTLTEKVKPIDEMGERLGSVLARQKQLEHQQKRAAEAAEERHKASDLSLRQLKEATSGLRGQLQDARTATEELGNEQKKATATIADVGKALAEVQTMQQNAVERAASVARAVEGLADAAEGRLERQQELLGKLHSQTQALVLESTSQQDAIERSSSSLLVGISRLQHFQSQIERAVLSIEAIAVYVGATVGIIVLTMPERTHSARFACLVLGPVAAFVVEKYHLHDVAQLGARLNLGPAWSDLSDNELQSVYAPVVRQAFAAVVSVLLVITAAMYETPERKQRRIVREAVSEALRDPATISEVARALRSGYDAAESGNAGGNGHAIAADGAMAIEEPKRETTPADDSQPSRSRSTRAKRR